MQQLQPPPPGYAWAWNGYGYVLVALHAGAPGLPPEITYPGTGAPAAARAAPIRCTQLMKPLAGGAKSTWELMINDDVRCPPIGPQEAQRMGLTWSALVPDEAEAEEVRRGLRSQVSDLGGLAVITRPS